MWGITLRFFDGNDIALAIALGVFYENKGRSWRRAARTAAARYLLSVRVWTAWELKSVIGLTTAQTYEAWARKKGAEVLTDELPEGAKLHWIGPRKIDRVILYFPGASITQLNQRLTRLLVDGRA
jgi:hypothetical protein